MTAPEIMTEKDLADLFWPEGRPQEWFKLILYRHNHKGMPGRRVGNGRYLVERTAFLEWISQTRRAA